MADEKKEAEVSEDLLMKAITRLEDIATIEKGKKCDESKKEEKNEAEEEEEVGKSFADEAKENSDEIRKGVEVSSFLQDMLEETGSYMDKINTRINKSIDVQNENIKVLADVFKGFGAEIKSLRETVEAFGNAVPAGPKAIRKGVERFENEGSDQLTKGEITDRLADLIQKGKAKTADMLMFESTGQLRSDIEKAIKEVK